MAKTGKVLYNGVLAGYISETDDGYVFSYDQAYASSTEAKPVSLILPVKNEPYTSKVLFAFFDGLIPEGWLLDLATNYWKLQPNDRFELLLTVCRDTIGAVTVEPQNE
jgi:serine/threonine-protein kinase HipA